MEKRRMCPNCRAIIDVRDRVCPECGVQLGPRAVDLRASQLASSLMPSANLTAIIVLVINVTFFLVELVVSNRVSNARFGEISPGAMVALGAEFPTFVRGGQWWRLITAGFLHGGFIHILMNSWSLFILVTEVEQFYGTSRFIVAYILSTVTGFYAAYMFGSLAIGASAAAFGMFGVMLSMGLRHRADPLALAVQAHYRQWLILGLVLSLAPGISLAAHVGGFAGGFLVGALGGLPNLPNTPKEYLWKALAALAILITLYAFWQNYNSFHMLINRIGNT